MHIATVKHISGFRHIDKNRGSPCICWMYSKTLPAQCDNPWCQYISRYKSQIYLSMLKTSDLLQMTQPHSPQALKYIPYEDTVHMYSVHFNNSSRWPTVGAGRPTVYFIHWLPMSLAPLMSLMRPWPLIIEDVATQNVGCMSCSWVYSVTLVFYVIDVIEWLKLNPAVPEFSSNKHQNIHASRHKYITN